MRGDWHPVNEFSPADGIIHFGKGPEVTGRICGEENQVSVHAHGHFAGMFGLTETFGRCGGQCSQHLLKAESGLCHPVKFIGGGIVCHVPDVGAEQDLSPGLCVVEKLLLRGEDQGIVDGGAGKAFDIPFIEFQGRNEGHMVPQHFADHGVAPWFPVVRRHMRQNIDAGVDRYLRAFVIGGMGEDRFAKSMGGGHRRLCDIQGHIDDLFVGRGCRPYLDTIRSGIDLLFYVDFGFPGIADLGKLSRFDIKGAAIGRCKRDAYTIKHGASHFTCINPVAEGQQVGEIQGG